MRMCREVCLCRIRESFAGEGTFELGFLSEIFGCEQQKPSLTDSNEKGICGICG